MHERILSKRAALRRHRSGQVKASQSGQPATAPRSSAIFIIYSSSSKESFYLHTQNCPSTPQQNHQSINRRTQRKKGTNHLFHTHSRISIDLKLSTRDSPSNNYRSWLRSLLEDSGICHTADSSVVMKTFLLNARLPSLFSHT